MRLATFALALAASGCLSTGTTQRRDDLRRALEQRPAPPHKAATPAPPGEACDALARAVAERHPRVLALLESARAASGRADAAAQLPPPNLSLQVWDFPVGDPSRASTEGMYMLGIGQMLTPPGMREGATRAELEMAAALTAAADDAGRGVYADVAHACVDWSTAQRVLKQAAAHRALVGELREAMLASYRGGGDSLAALAQADGELAAAQRFEVRAQEELLTTGATLKALVGGDATIPAAPPGLPTSGRDGAQHLPDADTLVALALRSRGDARGADAEVHASEAQEAASAAAAVEPEVMVRAAAMKMPLNRLGASLMLEVSLPWLWGGGADRAAAARHGLAAAAARGRDVERRVRTEVVRATRQLRAVERSLEVLTSRELPAARHLIETERAALISGNFDMTRWLAAAHALREAHVDEARSHGDLAHALVSLRAAVGAPLPVASTEGDPK